MIELTSGEVIESLNIKDYKIIQSSALYKFTSDSVLLSRFARGGAERVCDLCAGSGIVSLHYYALNDDKVKSAVAVEIQSSLADMCKKSVALNGLEGVFKVENVPVQEYNSPDKFDLVLCNPPYEKAGASLPPKNAHLAICKTEAGVTLEEIIACAKRLLKEGGRFVICHKAARLTELINLLSAYKLNPSRLQFVSGGGEKAYLVLCEAIKGKKEDLEVYSTVINDFTDFSGER